MPEWSNGTVSKTVVRATVPRVRIPLFPPSVAEACATAKALAHAVSVGDLLCLKMLSSFGRPSADKVRYNLSLDALIKTLSIFGRRIPPLPPLISINSFFCHLSLFHLFHWCTFILPQL